MAPKPRYWPAVILAVVPRCAGAAGEEQRQDDDVVDVGDQEQADGLQGRGEQIHDGLPVKRWRCAGTSVDERARKWAVGPAAAPIG